MPSPTPRKSSITNHPSFQTPTPHQSRIPRPSSSSREPSPPPYSVSASTATQQHNPSSSTQPPDDLATTNGYATTANGSPNTSPWSSAVGRASLAGKSGRVIEKLQSENDRLRRDLKLVTLQREEEQKRAEIARQGLESLRGINENLASQATAEQRAVDRKDKILERVKGELDRERELRTREGAQAEAMRADNEAKLASVQEDLRRETEEARLWRTRHDALSSSWKRLEEEHKRNLERMRTDLDALQSTRKSDAQAVRRYETTVEQQSQEVDRMRSSNERMRHLHAEYKAEVERETKGTREAARRNEVESERILEESKRALGEMRYLNNISKYVSGIGVDGAHEREEVEERVVPVRSALPPALPVPQSPVKKGKRWSRLGFGRSKDSNPRRDWELRE